MSVPSPLSGLKIGIIGAGNMGQALARGLAEKSVYPQNLSVFDIHSEKLQALKKECRIKPAKSARQCVSLSDVVILAVKPHLLEEVIREMAGAVEKDALVISVAAGVTLARIESFFKKPVPLVRVMPNMPALLGAGMSAFSLGRRASAKHRKIAEAILGGLGEKVEVPERMLDLVTAVSGSGPAYFFLLAEKLIEAAYQMGMKAAVAKKLVYQTAFGSGKVMTSSDEDPDVLIGRVVSKGGTTEAALRVFQKEGLGKVVQNAVKAAYKRSKEISEGA
ncbi:MAG: pyrroline-5-carboxylate reductase [Candidatus Omnitrophica bacterium]|nr:pyrroline-5-carboxylate reductase [Candidatus Omnitrophota bacterium]